MNRTNDPLTRFLCRVFDVCSRFPLLVLVALLALQTVFLLDSRELWFSDEIRYANVYEHLANAGKWIVMHLNGQTYPDKPPVYFWFLHALSPLTGGASPMLFFLGAAVSGLIYLASSYVLFRTVAQAKPYLALAGGLVLLSVFYFVGLTHYSRMDLLFAAFILLSHACLFQAVGKQQAMGWTLAGFFLAAVATLTKGPLGLGFPVAAMTGYLLWTGRPGRLLRKDMAAGLALALLVLLVWAAGAWFTEQPDFLRNIFVQQIYKRAADTWHHGQPWYYYLYALPLTFLPWTFLLLLSPLAKLPDALSRAWLQRKQAGGWAYVWSMLFTGFVLLSALSIKIAVYLMPLFAPLALVTAKYMDETTETRSRWLFAMVGGLFGVLALSFLALMFTRPILESGVLPVDQDMLAGYLAAAPGWEAALKGALPSMIICAGASYLLLAKMDRKEPLAGLLLTVLAITAMLQPLGLYLAPCADTIMSPKGQAEIMAGYAKKGYAPMAFKIYSGTYTYYLGQNLPEYQKYEELEAALAQEDKAVLGMQRKRWDQWENKPTNLRIVDERVIVERPYVLAVYEETPAPPNAAGKEKDTGPGEVNAAH